MSFDKILVTGALGFIGTHTVKRLLNNGVRVNLLDKEQGGILNLKLLRRKMKGCDGVIHLAAIADIGEVERNPMKAVTVNIRGTANVLCQANEEGIDNVVAASSSSVYGDAAQMPIDENVTYRPLNTYGATKITTEDLCRLSCIKNCVILRYFNVYGLKQKRGVIPSFTKCFHANHSATIYGGSQTRDFVHVSDVVRVNLLALRHKGFMVFNVGTGKETSIISLFKQMSLRYPSYHRPPSFRNGLKGDVQRSCADTQLAERVLGFKAKIPLEEGLTW